MTNEDLICAYKAAYVTAEELATISPEQMEQRNLTFFQLSCEAEDLGIDLSAVDRELDPGIGG